MASMDESPPDEWTGRTPKTASANDQLDTENQLKKGPVPRPPKAPATPNSRQPGGKASRDPNATSAAVEADRRYATQEHQRKTRPSHDRISPRLAALNLDSVADEPPVEAPAPAQNSTSGVLASVSGAMTSAFASAAGVASMAIDAVASAVAGRDATFAVDEEVPVAVAVPAPASGVASMAVDAAASVATGQAATIAVTEEAAVAVEASIDVDEEVAEGLAAAAQFADEQLAAKSANHADRLAAATAATEAANLEKLRAVVSVLEELELVVENGGKLVLANVKVCRVPGLVSFEDAKGANGLGAKKTLPRVRTSIDAAVTNVTSRARDQVIGDDYDASEDAFAAALSGAETDAEKLAHLLARARFLSACSISAVLSTDRPIRVISETCSGVASHKRIKALMKAAKQLDVKGRYGKYQLSRLEQLDRLIRIVGEKLAEEPAEARAMASIKRYRSCLSDVNPRLEAELFTRLADAWRPFASKPDHRALRCVPFDAAEHCRLRAVVESYQGKPTNTIGHVRFGMPLEPGMLPGLNPPRDSTYLVPVGELSLQSIEYYAASLAHGEKSTPHLYSL